MIWKTNRKGNWFDWVNNDSRELYVYIKEQKDIFIFFLKISSIRFFIEKGTRKNTTDNHFWRTKLL